MVSKIDPSPTTEHISTALTLFFPKTFVIALPNSTLIPKSFTLRGSSPTLFSLTSITRGILIPAFYSSIIEEYAESLFVMSITLSPCDIP